MRRYSRQLLNKVTCEYSLTPFLKYLHIRLQSLRHNKRYNIRCRLHHFELIKAFFPLNARIFVLLSFQKKDYYVPSRLYVLYAASGNIKQRIVHLLLPYVEQSPSPDVTEHGTAQINCI